MIHKIGNIFKVRHYKLYCHILIVQLKERLDESFPNWLEYYIFNSNTSIQQYSVCREC